MSDFLKRSGLCENIFTFEHSVPLRELPKSITNVYTTNGTFDYKLEKIILEILF